MTGIFAFPFGMPVGARVDRSLNFVPGMTANMLPVYVPAHPLTTFDTLVGSVSTALRQCLPHQRGRFERSSQRA
ncbi:enterobactin synthetase component F [Rhodococcoides kyotonense]|uniref:Enterobactin synthetase component F n=2 Tax=Rhodococcoides kyotonense TaxID=398843 RepID=A0A239K8G5_9NOCA|nr:enterobactin synthetase component F [Rhodococcus kyotonensis]